MKKWVIIILVIIMSLCSLFTYSYIQLVPSLKAYGKMEMERLNQLIITHSYFINDSLYDDLIIMERNEKQEIVLLDFDMVKANHIASLIVADIEKTYTSLEEGTFHATDESYYQRRLEKVAQQGIISYVPLTTLFNLPSLSFFSPSIPIKYKHLSSVGSSVVKKIENYGVNHVMVELDIEIHMNLTMVYPFFEQYHTHTISIPILLEIFQGQVPLVYNQ